LILVKLSFLKKMLLKRFYRELFATFFVEFSPQVGVGIEDSLSSLSAPLFPETSE